MPMIDAIGSAQDQETSFVPFTFDDCDLAPIVRSIPLRGDAWVSRNALHVTALGVLLLDITAELATINVGNPALNLTHYTRIHCLDIDDETGLPVYFANDSHQAIYNRESLASRFVREPEIPQNWRSQSYMELMSWVGNIMQLDTMLPHLARTYNYAIPELNVPDHASKS